MYNITEKIQKNKARCGRLLRPLAWKQKEPILKKVNKVNKKYVLWNMVSAPWPSSQVHIELCA